jgi:polar amino acid transport system permease protein
VFLTVTASLLEGFVTTVRLFVLTLVFALPLGLIISFGSMSRFRVIRLPIRFLIWVVRGTPLLLQLLIIYYGPGIIFHNNVWGSNDGGRFTAALVAFAVNYACYFSEIYRGGIQGVPRGQQEAGQVLGMTRGQIFFKVTLLQMVKRIVPPMSNEVITLVKDTALANYISLMEIIMTAKEYTSSGLIWPLFATAIYFLAFVGVMTLLFGWLEKRLDYFKA